MGRRRGRWNDYWRPYVPVSARRRRAGREVEKLRKKGVDVQPVEIEGRKIARSFWGEAWCEHLEKFSDYANRLPRGRTYVRNGSVCHLQINPGSVEAMVSGSEIYTVTVDIDPLSTRQWTEVKKRCAGQIGSLLELLQGKLSTSVMQVVTDRNKGLFPRPKEIHLHCSCPDWAVMCKHVAAVLYGVGARLDEKPELLFLLRGVDHEELIATDSGAAVATAAGRGSRRRVAGDLEDVFGIDIVQEDRPLRRAAPAGAAGARRKTKKKKKKPASRRPPKKKGAVSGRMVARLREKFGMSRSQFARLLGVSAPTIANWEGCPGRLNLQFRTRRAWQAVAGLSKKAAWKRLGRG